MAILGILVLLRLPVGGWIQAPGPATPGHGEMRCAQCHERAEGSLRQQLQATVQHALGMRETGADIGHRPVGDRVCIDCHDRPNDRHPTVRVTAPSVVCQTCHGDLDVRDDPVEPTHADLVAREDWTTCLRCHDFHGNHTHVVAESLADAISVDAVLEHLGSGPRAYGPVTHEARSTPQR